MTLPVALAALGRYRQFITYRPLRLPSGKIDKIPCDYRSGQQGVNPHDPQYHTDYETARKTGLPVGFVLTDNDPFFCLDIDGCLQADSSWSPLALAIIREFPGAAVEVSMSGRGLHIWGTYKTIPPHRAKDNLQPRVGLELYHNLRFIALGNPDANGDASADCTQYLPPIIARYFPKDDAPGAPVGDWSAQWGFACAKGALAQWRGPTDDTDLLRRAMRSVSVAGAFGGKAQFVDLWNKNVSALAVAYPSNNGKDFDESSADAALAAHLRFWTGEDCVRIERLMRQSSLARDKYDREDYLPRTIMAVIGRGGAVCQDKPPTAVTPQLATTCDAALVTPRNGDVFADAAIQAEYFRGCTYITDTKEMLMPNGLLWDQEQFDARMSKYVFLLDNENSKTTDKAWNCFMKSKIFTFPKADRSMFRPDLPTGHILTKQSGITYVNTYSPQGVVPRSGDASPFVDLVTKILPNAKDAAVLLAFLAFIAQYPGVKAQWAPVLQGVEGNGKSTIGEFMKELVGSEHYYSPDASELTGKFNGWLWRRRFICVEDMTSTGSRVDPIEWLKPKITQSSIEVERKGKDKVMVDFCANFMFNMNSKDGLRKTRNDRRLAFLYSRQQQKADLYTSGLTPEYFRDFKKWQRDEGYAIVAGFLTDYAIPDELNPVNGGHAPITSATKEAIRLSASALEQEILENIEQEAPGFAGGWVSSIALDQLLTRLRINVPINKRGSVLEELGYVRHPGLLDGRANVKMVDCGLASVRPVLYVRAGHLSINLRFAAEIQKAYIEAQGFQAQNPAQARWS